MTARIIRADSSARYRTALMRRSDQGSRRMVGRWTIEPVAHEIIMERDLVMPSYTHDNRLDSGMRRQILHCANRK